MSKMDEESVQPAATIRQKCIQCVKGPNLIRTLVVVICSGVVIQQIAACVQKMINIPITTYTHFEFNETIKYPSLTFCREPPYKYDKLEKYGLYAHPRFTSTWRAFNFSQTSLDKLWEDTTYTEDEFFVQYGLDGQAENVAVESRIGFIQGKCHTLTPKVVGHKASRSTGYSLTLRHSAQDIANSISTTPPGYHVYVHYSKEPFTEVAVYNGGLIDYLYVNTGETLDVKLTVDQYHKISRDRDPCVSSDNYSANQCTTEYVSRLAGEAAGCSGPWMISRLPRCDNYNDMRTLIATYINVYEDHNCSSCPRICNAYLYNAFVSFRRTGYTWDPAQQVWALNFGDAMFETHLYFHFNTMMVSVYEERYNYDWNLFISDLGGSIGKRALGANKVECRSVRLVHTKGCKMKKARNRRYFDRGLSLLLPVVTVGFLLGLSVIGLITIFGKAWSTMVQPFCKPRVKGSKASTADIKTVAKEMTQDLGYMKKCEEWHVKNHRELYT